MGIHVVSALSWSSVMTVAGAMVVLAALAGLGTLPSGWLSKATGQLGVLELPLCLIGGWAIAAIFSASLAPWRIPQTIPSRILIGCGLLALLNKRSLRHQVLHSLALGLPLAVMTAVMPATQFDEFSHWLPNTRFLVDHDAYWLAGEWLGTSNKPSYPNGVPVIALLVSRIAGPAATETAFKTFMVFCIVAFGWLLAGARNGRSASTPTVLGFVLLALVDPFLDPRISLTSYADAPTGIVLAVAGLAAAAGLTSAKKAQFGAAEAWFAWTGLACGALVMLRSTNLVLVAAVFATVLVNGSKDVRILSKGLARMAAPPFIGVAVWQVYLHVAGIGPDMSPRPPARWDWAAPLSVLRSLFGERLVNNPKMAIAAAAILVAGVGLVIRCRAQHQAREGVVADQRSVFLTTAVISGCFLVFLAWTYMAVFTPEEVARAASAWRYLAELGPILTLAVVVGLPRTALRTSKGVSTTLVGGASLAIVLSPIWGRGYYGVACRYGDVVAARSIISDLRVPLSRFAPSNSKARRVVIAHPAMANWFANVAAYDLGWPVADRSFAYRLGEDEGARIEQWGWDVGADAVLDLSVLDRQSLAATSIVPPVALRVRPQQRDQPWPTIAMSGSDTLPPPCGNPRKE